MSKRTGRLWTVGERTFLRDVLLSYLSVKRRPDYHGWARSMQRTYHSVRSAANRIIRRLNSDQQT